MYAWEPVTVPENVASFKLERAPRSSEARLDASSRPLKRESRAAGPSSAPVAALYDLRAELRLLDKRISKLHQPEASKADVLDKQQQLELGASVGSLEADVSALREAALARFESIEDHLAALEDNNEALSERCSSIKRKFSELDVESRVAKRLRRRSARSRTPERAETRSARSRSSSPAPPASAYSPPLEARKTSTPKVLNGRYIIPDWSAGVALQSLPLPEGQEFASVLEAIKQAQEHTALGKLVNLSSAALHLRRLDPEFFVRHRGRWKDLIPMCQQYVAFILVLPPLRRNLKSCSEHILLIDPARPYYSRKVTPPDFTQQLTEICEQANITLETWNRRSTSGPLRCTPEPLPLPPPPVAPKPPQASSPKPLLEPTLPSGQASHLPPPQWERPLTLPPEWEERLSQPSFYHALVDILRRRVTVHFYVDVPAVLIALRYRLGDEYDEIMRVCGSSEQFFSLAARFIKISKGTSGHRIIFSDPLQPYYCHKDNDEYFRASGVSGPSWLHTKPWLT